MFPIMAGNSASTGYNLTRSVRLRASASAYLNRTPASASNRKTWTLSAWVKRGKLSSTQDIFSAGLGTGGGADETFLRFSFTSSDQLSIGGNVNTWLTTTPVYRDPSAWYHIVLAFDATQATATNRILFYVNGVQVTAFATNNLAAYVSNQNYAANNTVPQVIGIESGASAPPSGTFYLDGYLAEYNFIDGQALTPSSFGSTNALTGVWQPARYAGTYGTNGFYLPFTDNSALTTSSNVGLGKDFSGNGNYWTTNNISLTSGVTYDSMTDVPTLTSATAANFAVLNPIIYYPNSTTIADGNLKMTGNNAGAHSISTATIAMPNTGKWYAEFTLTAVGGSFPLVGLIDANTAPSSASYLGALATTYSYAQNGTKYTGAAPTAYGASYTNGDVIAIAFDATAGTLTFYKNNTSQGTAFSALTSTYFMAVDAFNGGGWNANFGQRPFTYTPPTGFVALNTFNLPTSTIVKGNTVFDATLYTGDGISPKTRTNAAGFQPDLVWIKSRSSAYSHNLFDSVRGAGAARSLQSDNTKSEADIAVDTALYGYLSAFNSNGFSTTNGSTTPVWVNQNGANYVAWQWQAGQGSSSSNTNGSITSTVSVNASAGFSVVTYTGTGATATVGHGLGVAPSFMISKSRSGAGAWVIALTYSGFTYSSDYFQFDTSAKRTDGASTVWVTAPTSSVFSVGSSFGNGVTFVNYCWTPIAGYSAFGSISTNSSADNGFAYTGFLSRFIMLKRTDAASNWIIWDTARNTFNVMGNDLYPNLSNAEASTVSLDIVSNGFKLRSSGFAGTWIYAAFATTPFKNSLGF